MSPHPVPAMIPAAETFGTNKTAEQMDEERQQHVAYEYLCRLEEAKKWMEACIREELPSTTDLEEGLRNGVYLAKLANFFAPEVVPIKKIFDTDFRRYHDVGLHFRHTDNINYFLQGLRHIGLPELFMPETTDIYDKKNMPRVIFCIHALSLFLFERGIAPQIQDLYGKVMFTDEEISIMRSALEAYGLPMPQFRKIGGILANEMPVDEAALHAAVIAINDALDKDDFMTTLAALKNSSAHLKGVDDEQAKKYHVVLKSHKDDKVQSAQERTMNDSYIPDAYDELLTQNEIQGHIARVNLLVALECVEKALKTNNTKGLDKALRNLPLRAKFSSSKVEYYMTELQSCLQTLEDGYLRMDDVESALEHVNQGGQEVERQSKAIALLNRALDGNDPQLTMKALMDPSFGALNVESRAAELYHSELSFIKKSSESNLRLEGVQSLCRFLRVIANINYAAQSDHQEEIWPLLTHREACFEDLNRKLVGKYMATIRETISMKKENRCSNTFLTHSEIQDVIDYCNEQEAQKTSSFLDEEAIIRFQARARGFLTRQNLFKLLQYYWEREDQVIRAQAIWKGVVARRKYRERIAELRSRKPLFKPLSHYRPYEKQILTIQRVWRQYYAKKEFEMLMKSKDMNLGVVRKYLHLLSMQKEDFEQELLLQSLKADISKAIRLNQQLEKDIDAMDIKIGLLVKNRISVQDVVAHSRNLTRRSHLHRKDTFYLGVQGSSSNLNDDSTLSRVGLKALRKESREKLDAYQHLFYLLQTNPAYLAKLVFVMPQVKTTKFLESVILTLYNFGSNQREEYLLLKLFKTALEEEIRCKVDKLSDIISGQPMVIKMIVSFNKSGRGQLALREMLGPLISRILEDKTLKINTNPVEIYKQWINQMETETGESCGLPYDVTAATALEHEEVQRRLQKSINRLKQVATLFLTTIVKSKNKLPYGILYMAKVLFNALKEKFSETPEKEILKVIGNLIYYRFINSAIVAPDSCDIIDLKGVDQGLNIEQRKNLGSVAKVLQFAASKKGFGEESAHLMCLNQYIIESHEKLKSFFLDCCNVPDPEQEFAMDQYTEATLIAKPVIYITLVEICDTHQLLLDYRYQVAPNEDDPLHELLDDLGGKPSLCSLLGAAKENMAKASSTSLSLDHLGQTEVCLTLTNKFTPVPAVDHIDADRLFVKTKQLILSVLPCTSEKNLMSCLKSKPTEGQVELYWRLAEKKEEADKQAENNRTMLDRTNVFLDDEAVLPLDDCKRQILKNLQILEHYGYVTKKDGFQSIISSIGLDIVNQKAYRTRRRKETFKLKKTLESLEKKHQFYQEQVEYYNQYLKQCLANLTVGSGGKKKKVRFQKTFGGRHSIPGLNMGSKSMKSRHPVKYTGAKLHDKGILLTIDGLPPSQFKNVVFEFVPSEEDGVFEVSARFMGVKLEHVDLDIQELLQLQFEGVSVMNIFGKARINVNLLLHFLNLKFYGKK